jgi:hypothetical protein
MSAFNESECLALNPFEGDFGEPGDRILEDKIVTARTQKKCCNCLGPITPGSRIRRIRAIFSGKFCGYNMCSDCCAAFAASWTDHGQAIDSRMRVYEENKAIRRAA